jgi:hemolysin III
MRRMDEGLRGPLPISRLLRLREPFNGLSHLAAALLALVGAVWLAYVGRHDVLRLASLLIYGFSLVLMLAASAAYHLVDARPRLATILRTLDHSAIYLLIAGTYTPICLRFLTGFWGWGLVAIIWSLAIIGIGVKVFILNAPRWLTAGLYLAMGWLATAGMREMLVHVPAGALVWLLAGGLLFTVGAAVYISRRPDLVPGVFGFHEIWHVFVILGCLSHYIVMAAYVAPPALAV